jgi:hypothetical protein
MINLDMGGRVMTREEQRMVKELRGIIDRNLKTVSKSYGFKVVSKCAYKVIDGFLYEVGISAYMSECGTAISAEISVRPCAIDDVFWEVYGMQEIARKKPFSFHITAAHVPYSHMLKEIEVCVEQMEGAAEGALDEAFRQSNAIIEQHHKGCTTIADFKAEIEGLANPIDRLNVVLCEIAEKNYQSALSLTEKELKIDRTALFAKVTDHGLKGIYEYIKEYLEKVLS